MNMANSTDGLISVGEVLRSAGVGHRRQIDVCRQFNVRIEQITPRTKGHAYWISTSDADRLRAALIKSKGRRNPRKPRPTIQYKQTALPIDFAQPCITSPKQGLLGRIFGWLTGRSA